MIVIAYRVHPFYPLIVAANRDEYFDRPTAPADFWPDAPQVLGGRDLKQGGTWLGVTKAGRFAAVTNYRDPGSVRAGTPSRGRLVADFLVGDDSPAFYTEKLAAQGHRYNGFNLLCGDREEIWYCSNQGPRRRLTPGIYGLSNALLDTPWPKVNKAKKAMREAMQLKRGGLDQALFRMLADRKMAPDHRLPHTGVSREWEKILSAVFIHSPVYGTRSSTIIRMAVNGRLTFIEKSYNGHTVPWMETRFSLGLKKRQPHDHHFRS